MPQQVQLSQPIWRTASSPMCWNEGWTRYLWGDLWPDRKTLGGKVLYLYHYPCNQTVAKRILSVWLYPYRYYGRTQSWEFVKSLDIYHRRSSIFQQVEEPTQTSGYQTTKLAMLLKVISSLCDKIKRLNSGIERQNMAIHQIWRINKWTNPNILHPSQDSSTTIEIEAISYVTRKHAILSGVSRKRASDYKDNE